MSRDVVDRLGGDALTDESLDLPIELSGLDAPTQPGPLTPVVTEAVELPDVESPTDLMDDFVEDLRQLAARRGPEERRLHGSLESDAHAYDHLDGTINYDSLIQLLSTISGDVLGRLIHFNPRVARSLSEFRKYPDVRTLIRDMNRSTRAEVLRQAILVRASDQRLQFESVLEGFREDIGYDELVSLIEELEAVPHFAKNDFERVPTLDLPDLGDPELTRVHRALVALKNCLLDEINPPEKRVARLRENTAEFVLNILNPNLSPRFINVSDVFGDQEGVPRASLDATFVRVQGHYEALSERYGLDNLSVFTQGTAIECPEQCGAAAYFHLAQQVRADRNVAIKPQVVVLNNAARVKSADGIDGNVEASQSTPLLYAKLEVGDVKHTVLAYGYQTLSLLKDKITGLHEIVGTEAGSQFRSLEHEQHIAVTTALADGALPACFNVRSISVDKIPGLNLKENEALFLGCDVFGNGITHRNGEEFLSQYIPEGENVAKVQVTIINRETGEAITEAKEYTLTRSLGFVRGGELGAWKSSTPAFSDESEGLLSFGRFKEQFRDINEEIVNAPNGAIIRVETI